jgi:hypothetical protein
MRQRGMVLHVTHDVGPQLADLADPRNDDGPPDSGDKTGGPLPYPLASDPIGALSTSANDRLRTLY